MICRLLLVFMVTCEIIASAQDPATNRPVPLTLDDAISIAQTNNRQVKNAELSAAIDDDQIAEARSYRFPSAAAARPRDCARPAA